MEGTSDEQPAVKIDGNTATTTIENPVVNTTDNATTVVSTNESQPTSSDAPTTVNATQSSPPAPTEAPVSQEPASTASVDHPQDPKPATIDAAPVDEKATETVVTNPTEPPSSDLPTTDSSATNQGVDLNFSPPINTPEVNVTPPSPPLINTGVNTTLFPTVSNIIANESKDVQATRPSAIFSIGGDDTSSLPLSTPDIVPAPDTTSKRVDDIKSAGSPTNVTAKKSPVTISNQQGSLVTYLRDSPHKLVLFAIVLAVSRKCQSLTHGWSYDFLFFSVLQLIIGWTHYNNCSDYPGISRYLKVAGFLGLVVFITCILYTLLRYFTRSTPNNTSFIFLRGPFIVTILSIILFILTILWWIRGSIWVFSVWKQVQYTDRQQANYCDAATYRTAFWTLIVTIVFAGIFLLALVQQIRRLSVDRKKGPATLVPTSEP